MCVSGIGLMVEWAELKSSSKSLSFRQYAACECSETNTFFFVSFCCDVRFFSEVNRSQTLNVRSECNANVKNSSAVKSLGDSLMRIFFLNAILSFLLENYNP